MDGVTVFLWACHEGHKNVEILLLKHTYKIEVNAKNNDGNTAAIIACRRGLEDIQRDYSKIIFLCGNKLQYLILIHLNYF